MEIPADDPAAPSSDPVRWLQDAERVDVALMVATETTGEDPWVTAPRTERPMTVVVDTTQNRVVEQIDMTPHGGL